MDYIGIDIGSTAAKVVARGDHELAFPPNRLEQQGDGAHHQGACRTASTCRETAKVVATGYGRVAVDYADYVITEITCHARGAGDGERRLRRHRRGRPGYEGHPHQPRRVQDFLMNDKCSAGQENSWRSWPTGWAWTLASSLIWRRGETLAISSLCTVFAESEVINYIGEGRRRKDIAAGVVDSVAAKVAQLAMRRNCRTRSY